MKLIFFLTIVLSFAKAGLLISTGILINKHFETVLSFIIRKPMPDDLISDEKLEAANLVIKWIGTFIILIGVGVAIAGLSTLITFNSVMPSTNFNFKF